MNLLYSETLLLFLKKVKKEARTIIQKEMALKCGPRRFWVGNVGYPLHFVAFDHPSKMGYFDPEMYEIGVNKCFLFETDENLKDLLRHELAHYLTFITHGSSVSPHGREFREICSLYGWKTEVTRATVSSEKRQKSLRIAEKIQKLFSLSQSHNLHEAELALCKARELLLKYHQTHMTQDSEEMEIHRLTKQKRASTKLQTIASILKHFFVYPVFNHGKGCVYLEIFGSPVNIEIATYVGHFLERELEILWKNSNLKGLRAKNSFFRGIAHGYEKKMQSVPQDEKAIISLENQLAITAAKAYPHLSSSFSRCSIDMEATLLGKDRGSKLQIRPGLCDSSSKTHLIGLK
ncbi:SprT-like domain-containing protein [Simkania sp.]|uniref:SprT-like domain-containing protein n=1 Tax=Simkania sp. TaxID=34094 RepID=UPI003B526F4F